MWLAHESELFYKKHKLERLGEPGPGFRPDSGESGPNRTRWTTKEVRWIVNETIEAWLSQQTRSPQNCTTSTVIEYKGVSAPNGASLRLSARALDSALAESCIGVVSNRRDFVPHEPRPQTLTRIVSRVLRRTRLISLMVSWCYDWAVCSVEGLLQRMCPATDLSRAFECL